MTGSKIFSQHLQSVSGKPPLITGTVEQSLKTLPVCLSSDHSHWWTTSDHSNC